MEANLATTDCGVESHDAQCLCDVVVTEPVPVRYSPTEVKYADIVMKYNSRLGRPWTHETMLDLCEQLGRAADLIAEAKAITVDCTPGLLSTYTDAIKKLIGLGHSMVDVPAMVGLTMEDANVALMSGYSGCAIAAWNEADWLAFEADVSEGMSHRNLARVHGLPSATAGRLARLLTD